MKKILSTLLVFLSLSVWCAHLTFSSIFVVNASEANHEMHENIWHDMSDMWCGQEEKSHECCFSPFVDSSIVSNVHNNEENLDVENDFWVDYLALLNNDFLTNSTQKLNSPPDKNKDFSKLVRDETYSLLVWIIKNNA